MRYGVMVMELYDCISHLRFVFFSFFFFYLSTTVRLLPRAFVQRRSKAYSARRQIEQEKKDTPLTLSPAPYPTFIYIVFFFRTR